ncbi:MAG: hypothetical protein EBU83_05785, partial [bacterium]|nr:hypothetical protein [Candidatus Aquidulcis sp.]
LPRMNRARQFALSALAAAALITTAAPSPSAPDTSGWSWVPMYFSGVASESVSVANDVVRVIKVAGDDLYVGGDFGGFAGGFNRDRIARWNNIDQSWHSLGGTPESGKITNGIVYSIEVSGEYVYVGGNFTLLDYTGTEYHNLAYFNLVTETWHGFPGPISADVISDGEVRAIYADPTDNSLYVGGAFVNANDNENADYLVVGDNNLCIGVVGACTAGAPEVSVCSGVGVTCAIPVPNHWAAVGDDGAGGPAISSFVSAITAHPDGGLLISGDFGNAGGQLGANSLVRLTYTDHLVWTPESAPSISMYPIGSYNTDYYVGAWEDVYRRGTDGTWSAICPEVLHTPGAVWSAVTPVSESLVLVGRTNRLVACNPVTGQATTFDEGRTITSMARFGDDLIVSGSANLGGLGSVGDYIAIIRGIPFGELPSTNDDGRQSTDTVILLATLAALTALAGTQLLRRA